MNIDSEEAGNANIVLNECKECAINNVDCVDNRGVSDCGMRKN